MDREIVGVGRAIQKTFARAFLNSVGFYGCLQQIEGKKNVIRVEQNVTKFVFVTSTFILKRGISLKHYEKYKWKGGLISLLLPRFSFLLFLCQYSLLSLSLFSILLLFSFLHLFSFPLPFLSLIPFSLFLSFFLIHYLFLTSFSSFPQFFSLSTLVAPFSPFLLCRSIPTPWNLKVARLKGVDFNRNYAIFLKMKCDST